MTDRGRKSECMKYRNATPLVPYAYIMYSYTPYMYYTYGATSNSYSRMVIPTRVAIYDYTQRVAICYSYTTRDLKEGSLLILREYREAISSRCN